MRKFSLVLTMLALVLVFGLAFVSCGSEDGNNNTPGGQTPGGTTPGGTTPGSGAQGYLTFTDIPAAYNGKYMYFVTSMSIETEFGFLYGCQNAAPTAPYSSSGFPSRTITCIQIANERAVLPMWFLGQFYTEEEWVVRKYSGNYVTQYLTAAVFYIFESPTLIEYSVNITGEKSLALFSFGSSTSTTTITFTNGNATVSGNDASLFWERENS